MQLGHAVDLVAGGQTQVGHANLAVGDDSHVVDLAHVVAILGPQILHQAAVDLAHNLIHTGHLLGEEALAPTLQSLAHNSVVGVGQGIAGDLPGLIPTVVVLVQQQTHQLGHAQSGVGVIDVDGHLVGQVVQTAIGLQVLAQNGLEGGRYQQILLAQAQPLASDVIIGRVEDFGDDLGHGVALQSLGVVAPGESGHIEAAGRLGAPQHQLVHGVGVVAGNIHVVGHSHDGLIVDVGHTVLAVVVPAVGFAAELDLHGLVLSGHQPHIAHGQPVVGELHLPAIDDLLLEDTKLIADGIARAGNAQSGGRIHIAGGQTAQTAVAQTGIRLHLIQVMDVDAALIQCLGEQLFQT